MRKKVFGKKLGRNSNTRKALFRSLSREVILHGGIVTTKSKALAVQPELEKLAMLVKVDSVNSRKKAFSILGNDKNTVERLFASMQKAVQSRKSGFTKITTLGPRRGDNVETAKIEWVEKIEEEAKPKVKETKKKEEIK